MDEKGTDVMTTYLHPGVYVEKVSALPHVIVGVPTSVVGFVGKTEHIEKNDFDNDTLLNVPTRITSWTEYSEKYGSYDKEHSPYLALSVKGFFDNGGTSCYIVRVPHQASTADFIGDSGDVKMGLAALEDVDINIICMPGVTDVVVQQAMITHCENLKFRFCILDSDETADVYSLKKHRTHFDSSYGALYYPWLKVTRDSGDVVVMPPSGFLAGVYARIDAARGVHKAPANVGFNGAVDVLVDIDDAQQDILNPLHINCLRSFPNKGVVIWGARSLSSNPEWKYLSVQRLFNFIEESIDKGTLWAVFEPNGEALWATIKSSIENFLIQLWRKGMLQGRTVNDAFFVQCDRSIHTQYDIDNGRVHINIGLAPLKPAEFIIINMTQSTEG